jgi:hypothetical protein
MTKACRSLCKVFVITVRFYPELEFLHKFLVKLASMKFSKNPLRFSPVTHI